MLDDADRRLIRLLQTDGRITNQELARRANLSPAAAHDRVRKLRERGVILGYRAEVDPQKVDRALLVFVEVVLNRTTSDVFDAFAEAARRTPEVIECHMVAGGFDYLIKVRLKDMKAYRSFLGELLVSLPGVRETRTYTVLEEVKRDGPLPV